jgi:DNA-binding GntR family transcriptional regulator
VRRWRINVPENQRLGSDLHIIFDVGPPETVPLAGEGVRLVMTQRTAAALAQLDELLRQLRALPQHGDTPHVIDEAEALHRAIAAFHMEAIRFRMYSVERSIKGKPEFAAALTAFDELRHELETAGFHTRSHTAP